MSNINNVGRDWTTKTEIICLYCGARHSMSTAEIYYIENGKKTVRCGGDQNKTCDKTLILNGDITQTNLKCI